MQPDDRRAGQRSRDGDDERSSLVTTASEDGDRAERCDCKPDPQRPREAFRGAEIEGERIHGVPLRLLELGNAAKKLRILADAREADHRP